MDRDDQILALTPFERPDASLAAAACRAGAVGVLDLGRDRRRALASLDELRRLGATGGAGVRLARSVVEPGDLPDVVRLVVLDAGLPVEPWRPRTVLVQATSVEEACAAVAGGADGVVAKGSEAGGRVGEEGTFVLLQRLLDAVDVPVWAQGGLGPNAAAAALAAGAAGVVLDTQLALVRESTLPPDVRAAVSAMDGSETRVVAGHRVYARPDLPAAEGRVPAELGADSLDENVLPAGQDGALAAGLPDTVSGVVRAVRRAVRENAVAALANGALRPDGPLARTHGIRYPIAQGPMTRVSDTAAFAEAVAEGGGLPFLALALLRGPEVRRLLDETAERLDGRPWGVGVLGFVPPELREEQLSVVHDVRPPVALVAGGRPAQARPLEEVGIATYLHVPSPALLDLFLKQGARRFVFEGRECGGHVGPRTSFLLWEQQLARLLEHEAPGELSVLFAGGIHDARSAAMVEVLAAPLAARGVGVGVLMGTAYLFTEEAVRSGAVLPAFQDTAIACTQTALLETGPGHATRCAETPYVESFRAERKRLDQEGRPRDEVWATLERLNVGRLRLAAKGLRRDGERLVEAGEDERRRDGMVMLGQVAALRSERTTVAELHAAVSDGAGELLQRAAPARRSRPVPPRADTAIVGMASVFPGAGDLEAYWANIVAAVDSVTEVPRERWNVDLYFHPDGQGSDDRTPSKWGGFVPDVLFDPAAYGIPPVSLAAIEPIQLLALEVSRRALADAGLAEGGFDRERAAVIFGADSGADLLGAYTLRTLWKQYAGELPDALAEALPTLTEDSFPGVLANVIAGRIANRLDLGGANYTIDAACASSLAAVDVAVKELRSGTSDLVVCGGADLHCAVSDYLMFASVHALSKSGRCRTFDASADGIALGEGVAAVVLKRLEDAQRDGDRVYAVVRGIGASSDGKSLGLTAPRREGQVKALERAYEAAGLSPAEVGLVEAHGTGTVVGDRTELETLTDVFTRAGAPAGSVALGSVKSQIGHTKCAAGLAGLVKTALALHRGVLPPTVHVATPNPGWDAATSPFTLPAEPQPWPVERRAAAVSAFGFGGTNFHAVLSGADQAESGLPEWPVELVLLRGESLADARAGAAALRARLESDARLRLRDVARSASRGDGPVQAAVVAASLDELRAKLALVEAGSAGDGVNVRAEAADAPGRLAFLFPGQGSQRVGMLRDLFVAFPHLRGYLELGRPWTDCIFPATAWSAEEREQQRAALTDTRVAQPALGVAGLAAARLLERLGVRPDAAAGHSYGELVALAVAGALREDDLLFLSRARGERILAAAAAAADGDPGAMAAVSGTADAVAALVAGIDGVVVANENAPDQVVVSGPTAAVEEAVAGLAAEGLRARRIPVACAFHSPLVATAAETFAGDLRGVAVAAPAFPVYANTTAAPHGDDPDAIRALLAEHVRSPVRFAAEIEAMYADGVRVFVETGPGRVLTNLVGRILRGRPHVAVALDDPSRNGIESLLRALAELAVNGVALDAEALYAGRDAELVDLAAAPAPVPSTAWWVNGHRARPVHGEPPAHALRPVLEPVVSAPALAGAPNGDRETVVLEYLRSVRELVDAQRRVVLAYLGETAPEAAALPEPAAAADLAPRPAPVPADPEPEPAEAATPHDLLLGVVSERTGYPVEMLDLDLDLEAELSIDSIKRIEILGALAERAGLDAEHGEVPEELAAAKTLRAILAWVETLAAGGLEDAGGLEEAPALRPAASAAEPSVDAPPLGRFVLELADAATAAPATPSLAGRRIALVPDHLGVAGELERRLAELGVEVVERAQEADGLVDLSPLDGGVAGRVAEVFARVRAAVLGGARWIVVATPLGGGFGRTLNGSLPLDAGGLAGLLKTVAKEYPDRHVRTVDLHVDRKPAALAAHVLDELLAGDRLAEVGVDGPARRVLEPVPVGWNGVAGISLGSDSVVLLTGGARGITARTALELARRFGCRLELVGRSPQPPAADGDAELAAATDLTALRGLLARRGSHTTPAEVEAAARRIHAENEIRATLAALRAAGSDARYHELDVRDGDALARLVGEVRARHGRLDGIVHGAGVIEDKLLADKTPESFARVWDTKAAAAATLAAVVPDDLRFLAFFSSVSGAFGNPGQADYAAANDFLDKLAVALNGRVAARVVSINWGPWANGGMVSPELEREYARRGVGLIAPAEGAASFVAELLHGGPDDAQVILTRAEPSALA